ncbi:F0F1 ATP synthase subunit delta [Phytohalomonas tamaricis]|uniref:F0F1 ATP synthase subunit delta n=1 Tax=Phytohalomonas tamaricis TaxID=2081032 RepID=UPI000D0AF6EE|nr:F0F1 ATP synthase subunit delta [Phytohalomonas tamaricis]
MAETSTFARPYAKAAFELARDEKGGFDRWSAMLTTLAQVIEHERIQTLLHDPRLADDKKAEIVIEVCGDALDEHGRNFVHVLGEQDRLTLLPEAAELFEHERAEFERRVDVTLISAYALDDEQQGKLASALKKRLNREISITTQVDKSLLGGVIIRAGDTVIDGSVRGRLAQLTSALNV